MGPHRTSSFHNSGINKGGCGQAVGVRSGGGSGYDTEAHG